MAEQFCRLFGLNCGEPSMVVASSVHLKGCSFEFREISIW
jgi:hypothetical protein